MRALCDGKRLAAPPACAFLVSALLAARAFAATTAAPSPSPALAAEAPAPGFSRLTVGLGLGLGFFTGADHVTDYIDRWVHDRQGTVILIKGKKTVLLNFVPGLSVTFRPIRPLRLQVFGEYGWGPKIVEINSNSRTFHFTRASVGGMASLDIPTSGSTLSAVLIGAGPVLHAVAFEEHRGRALGFRAQVGFVSKFMRSRFGELYVAFSHAAATSASSPAFALDHSSVIVGGTAHFGFLD